MNSRRTFLSRSSQKASDEGDVQKAIDVQSENPLPEYVDKINAVIICGSARYMGIPVSEVDLSGSGELSLFWTLERRKAWIECRGGGFLIAMFDAGDGAPVSRSVNSDFELACTLYAIAAFLGGATMSQDPS